MRTMSDYVLTVDGSYTHEFEKHSGDGMTSSVIWVSVYQLS